MMQRLGERAISGMKLSEHHGGKEQGQLGKEGDDEDHHKDGQ